MKKILPIISALIFFLLFSFTFTSKTYADGCTPFTTAPNLYQVNRVSSTSATLYFTPLNDSIQSYMINYGLSEGDRRYNAKFDHGPSTGALSYTINGLDPAFTYYYSVSAVNPCSQSPWSNWLSDTRVATQSATITATPSATQPNTTLPAPGSGALLLGVALSGGLVFGGTRLFGKQKV